MLSYKLKTYSSVLGLVKPLYLTHPKFSNSRKGGHNTEIIVKHRFLFRKSCFSLFLKTLFVDLFAVMQDRL